MSVRTNLAIDPRGTGSAPWKVRGFTESAGDPLAGQKTSRRFTRDALAGPRGSRVVTNYAHLLDCATGTTTGTISTVLTGDTLRCTYTVQGNTGWSDSLAMRVTRRSGTTVSDVAPCKAGDTIYCQASFRASRPRSMRWRYVYVDAAGAALGSALSEGYTPQNPEGEFLTPPATSWVVPNNPAIAGVIPYIGSGPSASPSGFLTGDWFEARNAIITVNAPITAETYFDGATPDRAPTDTAIGADFAWVGAANSTASTMTPILQTAVTLPVTLPASSDVMFRIRLRADQAMPGGRLVFRPTYDTPTAEVVILPSLDLPAGESRIDVAANTGPTSIAGGISFVWGSTTGGPVSSSLEATSTLVEILEAGQTPEDHPYFDGYTLDVLPTPIYPGIDYAWTGVPDHSTSTATDLDPVADQTRSRFAAALSAVDGITGSPMPPRTLGRGQGWPVWQSRSPLTMLGDENRWLVHVTLPAGMPDASILEASAIVDQILVALSSVGVIEQIEPDALMSTADKGSQPIPALTVTITTTT